MACVGIRPVVVHGGGPEINIWLGKLGIEPQFKDGLAGHRCPHHGRGGNGAGGQSEQRTGLTD